MNSIQGLEKLVESNQPFQGCLWLLLSDLLADLFFFHALNHKESFIGRQSFESRTATPLKLDRQL